MNDEQKKAIAMCQAYLTACDVISKEMKKYQYSDPEFIALDRVFGKLFDMGVSLTKEESK